MFRRVRSAAVLARHPARISGQRQAVRIAYSYLRVLFTQLLGGGSETSCNTLPREVLPDCDHRVTRRCSERRYFLRPDEETINAFKLCPIIAAQVTPNGRCPLARDSSRCRPCRHPSIEHSLRTRGGSSNTSENRRRAPRRQCKSFLNSLPIRRWQVGRTGRPRLARYSPCGS